MINIALALVAGATSARSRPHPQAGQRKAQRWDHGQLGAFVPRGSAKRRPT